MFHKFIFNKFINLEKSFVLFSYVFVCFMVLSNSCSSDLSHYLALLEEITSEQRIFNFKQNFFFLLQKAKAQTFKNQTF